MAKTVFMDIEGKVSELALYKITDIFPFPDKYLTVDIGDEHNWYIPLDEPGSEFDSGIRYSDGDKVYQVCTRCPMSIISQFLNGYNCIISCDDTFEEQLSFIFEGRMYKENGKIKLIAPGEKSEISKLFLCGTDIIVSYDNIEISTRKHAYGTSSRNTADTAHAILVKMKPGTVYTISYKNLTNTCKNFIFLGRDIENLPEHAGSYEKLYNLNYLVYNGERLEEITEKTEHINMFNFIKSDILGDKESRNKYNYFNLFSERIAESGK